MPATATKKPIRELRDSEAFWYLGKVRHITEPPKVQGNLTILRVNLDTGESEKMSLFSNSEVRLFSQPRRANSLKIGDVFDFLGQRNTLTKEPSRPNGHGNLTLSVVTPSGTDYNFTVVADTPMDVQV